MVFVGAGVGAALGCSDAFAGGLVGCWAAAASIATGVPIFGISKFGAVNAVIPRMIRILNQILVTFCCLQHSRRIYGYERHFLWLPVRSQ